MGLHIHSVEEAFLSVEQQESVCSSLVTCKNYEIGVLPAHDVAYVFAKNYNSLVSAIVIGVEVMTKRCHIVTGKECDALWRQLQSSRSASFSGSCEGIGVTVELDGSVSVCIKNVYGVVRSLFKVQQ